MKGRYKLWVFIAMYAFVAGNYLSYNCYTEYNLGMHNKFCEFGLYQSMNCPTPDNHSNMEGLSMFFLMIDIMLLIVLLLLFITRVINPLADRLFSDPEIEQ